MKSSVLIQDHPSSEEGRELFTGFSLQLFLSQVEKLTYHQRQVITKTGFGNLLEIPCRLLSKTLLAALMDRWSSETKEFIFASERIALSLMDVALILGLPVTGRPLILNKDEPFLDLEEQCGAKSRNRRVTLSNLEYRLDSMGGKADECFVRTFLLFAIGSLLLPDNYKRVDTRYLKFLENLDDIHHFAWGTIVLDDIIKWLNKRKDTNVKSVGGCLILLQIWAYEHLGIGQLKKSDGSLAFPRANRWQEIGTMRRQLIHDEFKKLQSRKIIHELQPTPAELQIDIIKDLLEEQSARKMVSETACPSDSCSIVIVIDLEDEFSGREMRCAFNTQCFEFESESDEDSVKELEDSEKSVVSYGFPAIQTESAEDSSLFIVSEINELMELNNDIGLENRYEAMEEQNVELKKENQELAGKIESLRNELARISVLAERNNELKRGMDGLGRENQCLCLVLKHVKDRIDSMISKYLQGKHFPRCNV